MTDGTRLDPQRAFSGTRPVNAEQALDTRRLGALLAEEVAGYAGPLTVRQFNGGQSNPTYELITPSASYVLRRKPPGPLLKSAHAVDREFRVISALFAQGYPVPRPHFLCVDETVIGSTFYVMEKVEGRVLWDLKLPGMQPTERRAIFDAQIDALAALHAFEPGAVGLSDFGRGDAYFARQIARWTKQYRASETRRVASIERLIAFLPDSIPSEGAVRIIHGDFRLDNMILAADRPEIRAVIDWELSTLGDPMGDLAGFLTAWILPPTLRNGLAGLDLPSMGIPSLEDMVSRYAARTGLRPVNLEWLLAFNLFRLAAICQGIAGRVRNQTAVSDHARDLIAQVEPLSDLACSFADKAGA